MMSILSQSTSRLSTTASVDTKITSNKETSQLLPDGSKYLPTGAFGIKSEYTMHKEVLSLKVKPKMMSATLLDMSVIDENTKEEVFKVHGKLASLHREVHVRTKNGKQLYTLKQSWTESKKSIYSFHAVDEESSLANANVFSAQAKGSLRNDCFDLSLTFQNQLDQGEKATMYLRTGIAKDLTEIMLGDVVVAKIIRAKSGLKKSNPSEQYQLLVNPGADSSLMLLSLICMHVQFVDWKVMGGSFFLAAAGLVGK